VGIVIALGVCCGAVAMIAGGPLFGKFCGNRFDVPIPKQYAEQPQFDESKLPGFGTVLGIILIPLVLILLILTSENIC
jgi:GntP family gluconate:H+ symporter/Gnt-I system low-affinity gluconate transporter